jgi:hypothetical protein
VLGGAQDNCGGQTASQPAATATVHEQEQQNLQMEQFLRNQPIPSFDWSLERHMLIQIYAARQRATNTYTYVQSEYTGKVLWSCPSIGFPLPYSTQLTNPQQVVWKEGYTRGEFAGVTLGQQEPNGLFPPPTASGTWVPCVNDTGKITPVYEERNVSTFLQQMIEVNGTLTPAPGSKASLMIEPTRRP